MSKARTHIKRNAVAYVALFVALGGTSFAAASLPRNSVKSVQIAPGAVGKSELKDNAVTSTKVKGLRASDFAPGQLGSLQANSNASGARGPEGPPGQIGAAGPGGPPGPPGSPGVSRLTYALAQKQNPGDYADGPGSPETVTVTASCPDGEYLTGGAPILPSEYQTAIDTRLAAFDDDAIPHGITIAYWVFDNPDTPEGDKYNNITTAICAPADSVSLQQSP